MLRSFYILIFYMCIGDFSSTCMIFSMLQIINLFLLGVVQGTGPLTVGNWQNICKLFCMCVYYMLRSTVEV